MTTPNDAAVVARMLTSGESAVSSLTDFLAVLEAMPTETQVDILNSMREYADERLAALRRFATGGDNSGR